MEPEKNGNLSFVENFYISESLDIRGQNFKYLYDTEPACNEGKNFGPLRFRYCQVLLYWCGIQIVKSTVDRLD